MISKFVSLSTAFSFNQNIHTSTIYPKLQKWQTMHAKTLTTLLEDNLNQSSLITNWWRFKIAFVKRMPIPPLFKIPPKPLHPITRVTSLNHSPRITPLNVPLRWKFWVFSKRISATVSSTGYARKRRMAESAFIRSSALFGAAIWMENCCLKITEYNAFC
ncbi:hypothetical protein BZA77DRAFT_147610 [Pyronema omphalodes]|nr:hypothetical protein BZA77DRAFT_147610 [Pyronema omphalodes]